MGREYGGAHEVPVDLLQWGSGEPRKASEQECWGSEDDTVDAMDGLEVLALGRETTEEATQFLGRGEGPS